MRKRYITPMILIEEEDYDDSLLRTSVIEEVTDDGHEGGAKESSGFVFDDVPQEDFHYHIDDSDL